MNPTYFGSNRPASIHIPLKIALIFYHGVKFGENRITFYRSPHIRSYLAIHVYAYKRLKNIGIVMKFSMNMYFVNLNHIAKFCYGQSIIAPRFKRGPLKKYVKQL